RLLQGVVDAGHQHVLQNPTLLLRGGQSLIGNLDVMHALLPVNDDPDRVAAHRDGDALARQFFLSLLHAGLHLHQLIQQLTPAEIERRAGLFVGRYWRRRRAPSSFLSHLQPPNPPVAGSVYSSTISPPRSRAVATRPSSGMSALRAERPRLPDTSNRTAQV